VGAALIWCLEREKEKKKEAQSNKFLFETTEPLGYQNIRSNRAEKTMTSNKTQNDLES